MATIKSYTDIEQSKKLSEILPLDSADMCYLKREINDTFIEVPISKPKGTIDRITLPCWSLAALLEVIHYPSLHETYSGWRCDSYNTEGTTYKLGGDKNNPIDACYEMILKLH